MKLLLKIVVPVLILFGVSSAATGSIEGYVTDKNTGETLPGVNIIVETTSFGAVSDIEGYYIIPNIPEGTYTIKAEYLGYTTLRVKTVNVAGSYVSRLDLALSAKIIEGETIVVEESDSKKIEPMPITYSSYGEARKTDSPDKQTEESTVNNTPVPESTPSIPVDGVSEEKKESDEESSSFYHLFKNPDAAEPLRQTPQASGLRAGFSDDNKQYNYFLNFLDNYADQVSHLKLDVSDRFYFKVVDKNGKSLPGADISVFVGKELIQQGKSYADGTFLFYPNLDKQRSGKYTVEIDYHGKKQSYSLTLSDKRKQDLALSIKRNAYQEAPLDILFILDTTGSMGDEIERLRATIDLIHLNLTSMGSQVKVRFGMVLYRDRDDDYVTQTIPLTSDMDQFRQALAGITAEGGGDSPEDLQSALNAAMKEIDWNTEGVRLGFIITDAEPHLDYNQEYTYADAVKEAKQKGIKLHSIGTGGLPIGGEYVLRQISQFTYGRYIFLTYGETGENEGGVEGSVSHHTGSNYQTDKLEAIVIQFAKEDLADYLDKPVESEADYFLAKKVDYEKNEETLKILFDKALSQLIDYSTVKLDEKTVLGLIPINADDSASPVSTEYLTQQVTVAVKENSGFTLADRVNINEIMKEWGLQLSGLTNDSISVKVGELLNAEALLAGNLFTREAEYELYLKLIRVETGELLSVTRLKIDRRLCPAG
ncbi:MAG: carboxypeptidase regulatory-like domain-containing protein [Calditrichaceae bacterium]|nr:carboxypeptidase regulatory-like domain-containing protein [Calditrichaceae bacterium]